MRKKRFEALLLSLVLALSPLSTMQIQAKNVSDDTNVKTWRPPHWSSAATAAL